MKEIAILSVMLLTLLVLAVRQYRLEQARIALELERQAQATRQHERFFARMDTATTDEERCDLCGSVSRVREMIDLADDVVLLCLSCAPLLRRWPERAA
jgi:hypothetical protein